MEGGWEGVMGVRGERGGEHISGADLISSSGMRYLTERGWETGREREGGWVMEDAMYTRGYGAAETVCIPRLREAPRNDLTSSRSTVAVVTSTSFNVNWEPCESKGHNELSREDSDCGHPARTLTQLHFRLCMYLSQNIAINSYQAAAIVVHPLTITANQIRVHVDPAHL